MTDLFGFPPKVFLIGSQKSGTTQLATLLGQHPDICPANPKEPDIFTRYRANPIESHVKVFDRPKKILLDASTSYSCAPLPDFFKDDIGKRSPYSGVPKRIFDTCKDSKFIYILRDPVDRTYSAYWHQVRAGSERRSLYEALAVDTYYLRTSHYIGQINLYLQYFTKDQFLFLFFEDFIKDPIKFVRTCFDFLNIKREVSIIVKGGQNRSFIYSGFFDFLDKKFAQRGGLSELARLIRPTIPDFLLELFVKRFTKPIPKITQEEIDYIKPNFKEANQMLKEVLNRDLLPWK